jgi:4-amino-4-deoxy-L-arabinose transferase-like glycosyltransferase
MALKKPQTWLLAAILIYFLYFFHLTATGMLGPDEPRYAAIGREMARSGDWVTPRLWGEPWFEKPALIYWMTAAGFRLGLNDDLAPRLPVAAVSVVFLGLYCWRLRRAFGDRVAWFATAILATSAGWIGMSHAGVPDIPLAATFSLAVLFSLEWLAKGDRRELPYAAGCLGLAVLAKGLVPLALITPVLWVGRRRLLDLLRPFVWGPFLIVAAPWYVACFLRNGWPFLDKFIWQHHVERIFSESLQHRQPLWFYLPVLLLGLFPWTPAMALIGRKEVRARGQVFLLIVGFGVTIFSFPLNKLPEYLLPLLPSLAVVVALGLDSVKCRTASLILALCAGLAGTAPLLATILPAALAEGIAKIHMPPMSWQWMLPVTLCVALLTLRPVFGVAAVAATVTAATAFLIIASLPQVDQAVSARPLWRRIAGERDQVCIEQVHRRYEYGLNYYSVKSLPDCRATDKPLHVVGEGGSPPELRRIRQ